ncbi:hypothetical protein [Streptomyces sp. NPDC002133]|uniref:hypothetical protein n=1 Tax=Streptomyces sp. NPDC002133 TaxID=3154409 RepID=UPI00331B930A
MKFRAQVTDTSVHLCQFAAATPTNPSWQTTLVDTDFRGQHLWTHKHEVGGFGAVKVATSYCTCLRA